MSIRELDEDDFEYGPRPYSGATIETEPPARILVRVCRQFSVTFAELLGQGKKSHFCRARQVAFWLLRQQGLPLSAIGHIVGYRDHSTVKHGIAKVERLRKTDAALDRTMRELWAGSGTAVDSVAGDKIAAEAFYPSATAGQDLSGKGRAA